MYTVSDGYLWLPRRYYTSIAHGTKIQLFYDKTIYRKLLYFQIATNNKSCVLNVCVCVFLFFFVEYHDWIYHCTMTKICFYFLAWMVDCKFVVIKRKITSERGTMNETHHHFIEQLVQNLSL